MSESPNFKYTPKTKLGAFLLGSGGGSILASGALLFGFDSVDLLRDELLGLREIREEQAAVKDSLTAQIEELRGLIEPKTLARIQALEAQIETMSAETTRPIPEPAPPVELETKPEAKGWRE